MLGKLTGWDDTIVAPATPPGVGAIAVIRLSGPQSIAIANRLFTSKDLSKQPSHTLHVGLLREGDELLDEVVVALYRAPRSYTGEDVVEISCHGSPNVQERILRACMAQGARLARHGEFTQRAFLHGKMDLAQAESVADLIASQTERARLSALHTLRGGFAAELRALREKLLGFSALMELELDFSQEDVEFADRKKFHVAIEEAEATTDRLLASFRLGNVVRNGVSVAIVGKPNAGKSTLLNALLNEERAIVSDIPGTTRDTVEEVLNIDGILFRLIDTAGIRDHTSDRIEQLGIEKSREKIGAADIVLLVIDPATSAIPAFVEADMPFTPDNLLALSEGADPARTIYLVNKSDAITPDAAIRFRAALPEAILISARTGAGVDALRAALLARAVRDDASPEATIVTNERHYEALQRLRGALADVHAGLDRGLPGDLLSPDIRRALHYLGEITGEVTSEEQLSWIFGRFCIGK